MIPQSTGTYRRPGSSSSLMAVRSLLGTAAVLLAAWLGPSAAGAAPPANDAPHAAAAFSPYTTANGRPRDQQAIAELVGATADRGVPRCFGGAAFARTVWYRWPEIPIAQEITVEATGRTLDVLDLAAFVQPEVAPPPAQPARLVVATTMPNACAGIGDGGAAAAEEPTSAVTLRVPANHPVLVQVGRRGPVSAPDDERALLSLDAQPLAGLVPPPGDRADRSSPLARTSSPTRVALAHATVTGEDPAQEHCPSLGTVWRRFVPSSSGRRRISVAGSGATTLTVFAGRIPGRANALDCVNREGRGRLEMIVPARKRRPLWIRIGSDRLTAPPATIRVRPGAGQKVIDGGPGGFDPTTGGPGGGFPAACVRARIERARIVGPRLAGPPASYNAARIPVRIAVRGASICDAELRLYGPRGLLYAQGRVARLKGRRIVRLSRLRAFRAGNYRLRVSAISELGRRVPVRTRVAGRLG